MPASQAFKFTATGNVGPGSTTLNPGAGRGSISGITAINTHASQTAIIRVFDGDASGNELAVFQIPPNSLGLNPGEMPHISFHRQPYIQITGGTVEGVLYCR